MLPPPGLSPSTTLDYATPISSALLATFAATQTPTPGAVAVMDTSTHASDEPPNGECRLLGPFALLIQAALGVLALMSLVYKRWRERPQRPLKIWFFDASKQVFGSALLHVANLLMSMLSSGQFSIKLDPASVQRRLVDGDGNGPNPCSFYLLNLAIDTTVGIPILVVLLRICHGLAAMTPLGNPPESIQSGNYGSPPRATWWLKQSIIYFFGLLGMKVCVLIIFVVLPWIGEVGDWALRWTEGNEKLQVFFVMLFFPVVMNAAQYYIIDGFIKKPNDDEFLSGGDNDSVSGDSEGERAPFITTTSTEAEGDGEDSPGKTKIAAKTREKEKEKRPPSSRAEYDPSVDGESASTPVAGRSVEGA